MVKLSISQAKLGRSQRIIEKFEEENGKTHVDKILNTNISK